jgi:large subunit ribosomal protein L4
MALSQKLKEGNLILVNGFTTLESYKTKVLANTLMELGNMGGRNGCSTYLVDHVEEDADEETLTSINGVDVNLEVAGANLMKVKVTNQRNVNVYDLIKHEKVVMSLSAFEALEGRYND